MVKSSKNLRILSILLALLLAGSVLLAQSMLFADEMITGITTVVSQASVSGTVTYNTGEGIEGVIITASNGGSNFYGITDKSGRYTIKVTLSDGNPVTVQPEKDYIPGVGMYFGQPSDTIVDSQNCNFVYYKGMDFEGRVRDEKGTAIGGADVVVTDASTGSVIASSVTSSLGSFYINNLVGRININISKMGYYSYHNAFDITKEILESGTSLGSNITLSPIPAADAMRGEDTNFSVYPLQAAAGSEVTLTLSLRNYSSRELKGDSIGFDLPDGATYVDTAMAQGVTGEQPLVKNLNLNMYGALDGSDMGRWSVNVKIDEGFEEGGLSFGWHMNVNGTKCEMGNETVDVKPLTANIQSTITNGDIQNRQPIIVSGVASSNCNMVQVVNLISGETVLASGMPGASGVYSVAVEDLGGIIQYGKNILAVKGSMSDGSVEYSSKTIVSIVDETIAFKEVYINTISSDFDKPYTSNPKTGFANINAYVSDEGEFGDTIYVSSEFTGASDIYFAMYEFDDGNSKTTYDAQFRGGKFNAEISNWSGALERDINIIVYREGKEIYRRKVARVNVVKGNYGVVLDGTSAPVTGAKVTCEVLAGGDYSTWNADSYLQSNPQYSDLKGRFSFVPPHGIYRIKVEKDGFETYLSTDEDKTGYQMVVNLVDNGDFNVSVANTNVRHDGSIYIVFNKPVDPQSVNLNSIKLFDGDTAVDAVISLTSSNRKIIFKPAAALVDGGQYNLVIGNGENGVLEQKGRRAGSPQRIISGYSVNITADSSIPTEDFMVLVVNDNSLTFED